MSLSLSLSMLSLFGLCHNFQIDSSITRKWTCTCSCVLLILIFVSIQFAFSFLFSQMKTIVNTRRGIMCRVFSRFACHQPKPHSMDSLSCATSINWQLRNIWVSFGIGMCKWTTVITCRCVAFDSCFALQVLVTSKTVRLKQPLRMRWICAISWFAIHPELGIHAPNAESGSKKRSCASWKWYTRPKLTTIAMTNSSPVKPTGIMWHVLYNGAWKSVGCALAHCCPVSNDCPPLTKIRSKAKFREFNWTITWFCLACFDQYRKLF